MKKVRLLFLTFLVIMLCTGCKIEYNINIINDSVIEEIKVQDYITSSRTKEEILNHYHMWYPVFVNYIKKGETIELEDFSEKANGIEYYEKSITPTNNGYNYTYKYNYNIKDYYDSYALATTFITPTVQNNGDTLVLRSSKENLLCNYDEFDSLTVNIKVNPNQYELNYTNSKEVKNNTYTWNLNRNNCNNSEIILTLNKLENTETIIDDENKKTYSPYTIYIFCGVLILLIIIGYLIFNKIKEKNNNFDIDD